MRLQVSHSANFSDGVTNPYRYLDFSEALRLMKEGYCAVRESWGDDLDYIFMTEDKDGFIQHGYIDNLPYRLVQDDILANDWYLVDDMDDEDLAEAGLPDVGGYLPDVMRTKRELIALESEACDRVWLDRKNEFLLLSSDKCQESFKRTIAKYPDLNPEVNKNGKYIGLSSEEDPDFYHGFWIGVLATTRWMVGDRKWDLDT